MNDTLKLAGRIGAELGAAKADNEKLRGLLRQLRALLANSSYRISGTAAFLHSIDAALSPQAEPADAFTAVDMATAAAQGFRDGQPAVEQAPAQDEQPAVFWVLFDATGPERFIKKDVSDGTLAFFDSEDEAQRAKRRHPGTDYKRVEYYRSPIAQTAPQGKFRMGDLVKKSTGSEWVGHVCGTYSTALTPEGYAVESEAHAGSVQIYPAKALEAVE